MLSYVMSMLSLLQFPSYHLIKPYLRTQETSQFLQEFVDLNITEFMLQVMPTCAEIFYECQWHGSNVNCCEIFELQRTEQGYCWSFNSLTSEATSHCPLSEVLENEGMVEEDDDERLECELRRTTGISGGSGLQIYLRPTDPRHNIGYRAQRVVNGVSVTSISYFNSVDVYVDEHDHLWISWSSFLFSKNILVHISYELPLAGTGVFASTAKGARITLEKQRQTILIHTSYELPLAGTGVFASTAKGARISLGIAAEITTSSDGIRSLPVDDRHCLFPDEEKLHIRHHVHPQHMSGRVSVQVHHAHVPLQTVLLRPSRIVSLLAGKFRFYRPPPDTPGITDRELMESLNCNCLATCFDTVYDIHLQRSIPEDPANQTAFSHVDIYYSKTGFVRYQRHIVFEFYQLIVSLGGVANLFLGCSLLSLIETIYWMLKILAVTLKTSSVKSKLIKVQPLNYLE
ncbi:uncharacterized protein LOC124371508 [Homalodisca vitripennis]|uniref:uncharacterized protein LOC124371508 n=1 Tax=Homalodisca vitripennis TaxID=197043 RepID=UPI001EEA2DA4|nr:uncharacterized protein LOC124371508 [Homalodisca vitripennis]